MAKGRRAIRAVREDGLRYGHPTEGQSRRKPRAPYIILLRRYHALSASSLAEGLSSSFQVSWEIPMDEG
ncbi:hypothetical protein CPLU01_03925 [Colletotrichum plurivorum]|uniref:Uncharacterized protein n=1 Tax=Colletotrichum plurivorum TaxID=2175906 RepID=A0A8H6KR77_9PEZI|nr:hypothetical protein CPLU01_03925 [Colletotrichum plurivorum]